MSDRLSELEARLNRLGEEVRSLAERLDSLQCEMERSRVPPGDRGDREQSPSLPGALIPGANGSGLASEALSEFATICFLLVVALALRTLTDNKVVGQGAGVLLGMGYSACLIGYGQLRRARGRKSSALFVVCGFLLLFSIVLETHRRFGSLPSEAAYLVLGLSLVWALHIGLRQQSRSALSAGFLGACSAALCLEFPSPYFPYPAALLLFAGWASYLVRRKQAISWLSFGVFALTVVLWWLWVLKARVFLLRGQSAPDVMALPFLFPMVGIFFAGSFLSALLVASEGKVPFRAWDGFSPAAGSLLLLAVVHGVARPWRADPSTVGWTLLGCAAAQLMAAWWFATLSHHKGRASTAFLLAGIPLTAGGASFLSVSPFPTLAGCSLLATLISAWSRFAPVNDFRVIANLLQALVCALAAWLGSLGLPLEPGAAKAWPLASLALSCLMHFTLARRGAAGPRGGFAPDLDTTNQTGLLPFACALIYSFAALRLVWFQALHPLDIEGENLFLGGQSILINLGALGLILIGGLKRDSRIVGIGASVAAIGAMRVFGHDLWNLRGLPLVFSMSSIGGAVSVGSWVWSRWNQNAPDRRLPD